MKEDVLGFRVRTTVGQDAPDMVQFKLDQTFEYINLLSLKIRQKNFYQKSMSLVGAIAGRVLANGAVGIPNAKISVFIPYENRVFDVQEQALYHYTSVDSRDWNGVRYNLLPDTSDDECHQNVGTMYDKRYMLDNGDVIEVFDKYYKYATTTNNSGDYFIYGVPVGRQTLHCDIDLSDIGILSQRPRDMVYKGYNIEQFESPNKFKTDTNLNALSQIISENKSIYVYPFWGDTSDDDSVVAITRCDVMPTYKFEPTCVFMGSIVTDSGTNAISNRCVPGKRMGKMSDLVTGEGTIEMIRKTFDGKVESFSIKGNRLIDANGVWCYQIPMNLDYVRTDEYGNLVPTDDPDNGIPTRARVRFRISLDEMPSDDEARKRARFLVPNNPIVPCDDKETQEAFVDYEFGNRTKDESYCNLFWNKVYSVKSYIPRLQRTLDPTLPSHTGIKAVNYYGSNNPIPYNSLDIRLGFVYRFVCILLVSLLTLCYLYNSVVLVTAVMTSFMSWILCKLGKLLHFKVLGFEIDLGSPFRGISSTLCTLSNDLLIKFNDLCDDGYGQMNFVPLPQWELTNILVKLVTKTFNDAACCSGKDLSSYDNDYVRLFNCIHNQLAQNNEVISFNFQNDWLNGTLYAPLWYRKIKSKRKYLFGLITRRGVDDWCKADKSTDGMFQLKLMGNLLMSRQSTEKYKLNPQPISVAKGHGVTLFSDLDAFYTKNNADNCYGYRCHEYALGLRNVSQGIIVQKETDTGVNAYYYKPIEKQNTRLFATDIILLGSLNDCDKDGVPQFFRYVEDTTFSMPSDLLELQLTPNTTKSKVYNDNPQEVSEFQEADPMSVVWGYNDDPDAASAGADWGNAAHNQPHTSNNSMNQDVNIVYYGGANRSDGGLFYGLTCWKSFTTPKSCINLTRVCEHGVTLNQTKMLADGYKTIPQGYISYDELSDIDSRAMFATMNHSHLKTTTSKTTGFPEYEFLYLYPSNFDGSLYDIIKTFNTNRGSDVEGARDEYINPMETNSKDYVRFRLGDLDNCDANYPIMAFDGKFLSDKDIIASIFGSITSAGNISKSKGSFILYDNSFYFYFGLKSGSTAIDVFRKQYYSECTNDAPSEDYTEVKIYPNTWCSNVQSVVDGGIAINMGEVDGPFTVNISGTELESGEDIIPIEIDDIQDNTFFIGSAAKLNSLGDAYRYYKLYETRLLNGSYTLKITDAAEEVHKYVIDMVPSSISIQTDGTAFTRDNAQLWSTYPNGGTDIMQEPAFVGGNIRSIGGVISIDAPLDGDTKAPVTEYKVVIEAQSVAMDAHGSTADFYAEYFVENGVIAQQTPNVSIKQDGDTFYVGTPAGGYVYTVTITQYCNGIATKNISTASVSIREPIPLTMYINGVSYSNIKNLTDNADWGHLADIGNDVSYISQDTDITTLHACMTSLMNDTASPNGYTFGGDGVLTEQSIRDSFGIHEIVEENEGIASNYTYIYIDGTYKKLVNGQYEDTTMMDAVDYFWANAAMEDKQDAIDSINGVIDSRVYVAKNVMNAFFKQESPCNLSNATQTINATGGSVPYRYTYSYMSESARDNADGTTTYSENSPVSATDQTEDPQMQGALPTLKPVWDTSTHHHTWTNGKPPYQILLSDAANNTLPINGQMFSFHALQKPFIFKDLIVWDYMPQYPYFSTTLVSDDPNRGMVDINGYVCGYVLNGIIGYLSVPAAFDTARVGGNGISIITLAPDGSTVPYNDGDAVTERAICSTYGSDAKPYANYAITRSMPGGNGYVPCVPIKGGSMNIVVTKDSQSIRQEIKNTGVAITECSCKQNGTNVSVSLKVSGEFDMFYLLRYDETAIPLRKLMDAVKNDTSIATSDLGSIGQIIDLSTAVSSSPNGVFDERLSPDNYIVIGVTNMGMCQTYYNTGMEYGISPIMVLSPVSINHSPDTSYMLTTSSYYLSAGYPFTVKDSNGSVISLADGPHVTISNNVATVVFTLQHAPSVPNAITITDIVGVTYK